MELHFICVREKKIKFSVEGKWVKTIGVRNIKKQEQGIEYMRNII